MYGNEMEVSHSNWTGQLLQINILRPKTKCDLSGCSHKLVQLYKIIKTNIMMTLSWVMCNNTSRNMKMNFHLISSKTLKPGHVIILLQGISSITPPDDLTQPYHQQIRYDTESAYDILDSNREGKLIWQLSWLITNMLWYTLCSLYQSVFM